MDVDVDQRRVDRKEKADGRLAGAVQHVAIGFAQGVGDHLVAHEAAIDEDVLGILGRAGPCRVDRETGQCQRAGVGIDTPRRADEIVAEEVGDAAGAVGRG